VLKPLAILSFNTLMVDSRRAVSSAVASWWPGR
jgi:hypothetical protein